MNTIENILLGVAIGDAFGAGIEFQDRNWIRRNVDFSKFINARSDVTKVENDAGELVDNYNEWDYTDDTEMTIGCIKALLSGQELTEDLLVNRWIEEYTRDKQRKKIGRHGHGAMRWLYSGEKSIEQIRDF